MTKPEKLQFIREKCIAANPDIKTWIDNETHKMEVAFDLSFTHSAYCLQSLKQTNGRVDETTCKCDVVALKDFFIVCSLELAKRLKELGVKQESLWYWYRAGVLGWQIENKNVFIPSKKARRVLRRNRFPHLECFGKTPTTSISKAKKRLTSSTNYSNDQRTKTTMKLENHKKFFAIIAHPIRLADLDVWQGSKGLLRLHRCRIGRNYEGPRNGNNRVCKTCWRGLVGFGRQLDC